MPIYRFGAVPESCKFC